MSGFKKFLLIIISSLGAITICAASSIIFPIPYVSDFVTYLLDSAAWAPYVAIGILVILGLFFVVLLFIAISAQRPIEYLNLKTETGTIKITKEAVLSALFQSLLDIPECRQATISLQVHRRKTEVSITISCIVSDLSFVNEFATAIQQRISDCLATTIGIPARTINVKIKEDKLNKPQKNARAI